MTRLKPFPLLAAAVAGAPGILYAQASPFLTGVTSLQDNILQWLTPIAIILVWCWVAWRWPIEFPGAGVSARFLESPWPRCPADRGVGPWNVRSVKS